MLFPGRAPERLDSRVEGPRRGPFGDDGDMDPMTNQAFLEAHGAPARVGLAGGTAFPDRAIRRLQRPLRPGGERSAWSHAFLFMGRREDGHLWVLESDLDASRRHIRLGVQENRADKYFDEKAYPNLAILDFGLEAEATRVVLTAALDLLAQRTTYALRELVGTLLALHRPSLRARENLLAREGALYCSALVQHCYAAAGLGFQPGVAVKNITPEDIAATPLPHTRHLHLRR